MEKIFWDFLFDGHTLVSTQQRPLTLEVEHWLEVGVEVIQDGSLPGNFCLVINREAQNVRIPNEAPVVKDLLHYFALLEGFDWQPLVNVRSHAESPYALCWRRNVAAKSRSSRKRRSRKAPQQPQA
jgi:hypothetical protein